jgi:hypothetical protein
MKKLILAFVVVCLIASTCFGRATNWNIDGKPTDRWWSGGTKDIALKWMRDIDTLVEAGIGEDVGAGDIYYVDSATAGSTGLSWATAVATIEEAYDLCTANVGDMIYVAAGHTETLGTLAMDTEGITIRGFGDGEDRPEIVYNGTGDIVAITAASNVIYNISFSAQVDAVVTGISISGDGDYTSIINCDFPEPANSTHDFATAIQLTTGADNVTVAYCTYKHADAIGPVEFIDGGAGAVQGLTVVGNLIYGEFSAAAIFSDQTLYAIQLGASATGWLVGNRLATDTYATALEAGGLAVDDSTVWVDYGQTDTVAVPYFANATGVARMSDTEKAEIEAEATDAIEAADLDHFITGAATDPTDNSFIAHICASDATADWSGFDNETDSLEAIRDRIDTLNTADQVDLDAILLDTGTTLDTAISGIATSIAAMSDTGWVGTNSATSQTAPVVTLLSGFGDDYFNTGWSMIIILNYDSVGNAPEGEIRDITDYVSATGTFTIETTSAPLGNNDRVMVKRTEELELDIPTVLGSSGTVRYVDSGTSGDGSGLTWENAYATLALAEAGCSADDIIYIAAGHDENEASGDLTLDTANLTVIGLGEGNGRPLITCSDDGTLLTLNAKGITVKNLRLQPGVTACNIGVDIGASAIGCTLDNVSIIDGDETTVDEFVIGIRVNAAASNLTVKNCTYYSLDATGHTENWIDLSDTTIDSPTITGCTVFGMFSEACIWGDAAVPVNCTITDNILSNTTTGQLCIEFTGAATGVCARNMLYSDTMGANAITIIDPGSLKCIDNWAVDAINETAIRVPISQETSDVTEAADGSDLERLEYLQNLGADALGLLGAGSAGNVWYCDSGETSTTEDGLTWATATDTLKEAIDLCTDNAGDVILVAAGHAENIGASVAIDSPGITIIGLGVGAHRPILTFNALGGVLAHTVPNVKYKNIIFVCSTQDTTSAITLDASSDSAIIEDCVFRNTTTNEFIDTVTLAGACDYVRFTRCKFLNNTAAGGNISCINSTAGVTNNLIIEDCEFYGAFTTAAIESTQVEVNLLIRDNTIYNTSTGDYAIKLSAAALGVLSGNYCYADTWGTIIDPGSLQCYENYVSIEIDDSGQLYPLPVIPVPHVQGTGRVIYVDSGATAGGGGTWDTAFNTIDAAMDDTSANRGDIIYVAQGHVETEAGAASIFTCDVAGVSIIGMGDSEYGSVAAGACTTNQIPTFILDHADATVSVTAANVTFKNLKFESDVIDNAIGVTVAGTADGFVADGCYFRDGAAAEELVIALSIAADADNVQVRNCVFSTFPGGGCANAILLAGGSDDSIFENNIANGTYSAGAFLATAAASRNLSLIGNTFCNQGVIAVDLNATTTGIMRQNYLAGTTSIAAALTDVDQMWLFENYVSGEDNKSGLLDPGADGD